MGSTRPKKVASLESDSNADSRVIEDAANDFPAATITLSSPGRGPREVSLATLAAEVPVSTVSTMDPHYQETRRFRCLAAAPLLSRAFSFGSGELSDHVILLEAKDGYQVRLQGSAIDNPDACFAFEDAQQEEWEPIGHQDADPGPLYLVWRGDDYPDTATHPRPWGIQRIELDPSAEELSHTQPKGGFQKDVLAARGYELFSQRCLRCHSINQEGGKLGPDLNVPRNILDYRPKQQVRAYIRNPKAFRYGTMPAHPDLSEEDLDALLRYLEVMGSHQYDPRARSAEVEKAGGKAAPERVHQEGAEHEL